MTNVTVVASRTRHSPCVGLCKLDDRTGQCLGCARTGDEIGRWSGMSEAERDAVWELLPARHDDMSIAMRLMPWMKDELSDWVAQTITQRLGTWVTGSPGATAEFPCVPQRDITVERTDECIIARASDSAFRLTLHEKIRVFAFGKDGPFVLGLPKARGQLSASETFDEAGPDVAAIDAECAPDVLFDMGLGRQASRFCVRTSNADLLPVLRGVQGQSWQHVMAAAGGAIMAVQPHRVVESKLVRIEVYAPIPAPGGPPPGGAHTHLLPELIGAGDEVPPSLALPDYALPLAIFYPASGVA